MIYTIDASYKNKQGREIGYRMPLWKGEATSASDALNRAHEALKAQLPLPTGTDTISLSIKGADGSHAMATEYAEDVEIARGASAVGSSSLLHDGVGHNLTPEQLEAAQKRIQDMAVSALPSRVKQAAIDKARGDALDDFFGEMDPAGKRKGVLSGAPASSIILDENDELTQEDFRQIVQSVAGAQDLARDRGNGGAGSGAGHPQKSGPGLPAAQPARSGGHPSGVRPDPLSDMREAIKSMEQNVGMRPREVIMTKRQYEHLKAVCERDGLTKPGDVIGPSQVYGLDITVVPDDGAQPPLQIVQPSRRRGARDFNIGRGKAFFDGKEIGEVRDFKVTIDCKDQFNNTYGEGPMQQVLREFARRNHEQIARILKGDSK